MRNSRKKPLGHKEGMNNKNCDKKKAEELKTEWLKINLQHNFRGSGSTHFPEIGFQN